MNAAARFDAPDRLLTSRQVLDIVPFGKTKLFAMLREQTFPAGFVPPGCRKRCWPESEIRAWIDPARKGVSRG